MAPQTPHKVSFGRTGRTLVYEDAIGTLLFVFDCSPADQRSGKNWNLHLSRSALLDLGGKFVPYDPKAQFERDESQLHWRE